MITVTLDFVIIERNTEIKDYFEMKIFNNNTQFQTSIENQIIYVTFLKKILNCSRIEFYSKKSMCRPNKN